MMDDTNTLTTDRDALAKLGARNCPTATSSNIFEVYGWPVTDNGYFPSPPMQSAPLAPNSPMAAVSRR